MFCIRAIIVVVLATAIARADDAALYREGFAQFQKGNYDGAGRALSGLAPFAQEKFGEHARYLLARTHELSGERPEAAGLYDAIIDFYTQSKREAERTLRAADSLNDRPQEKARLEALANDHPPQYVVRSLFYSGRLLVEEGRYEEAIARLERALPDCDGALAGETKLWLGVAQVQTKKFDDAIDNLRGLTGFTDAEALRWMARAQVGLGITPVQLRQNGAGILPTPTERRARFESGIEALKKAVEFQGAARDSRGLDADEVGMMMELADLLRQAEHYQAAVEVYGRIANECGDAQLVEKARYRQAVGLQLAGKFGEADAAIEKFAADYPRSVLSADAAVRYGENALLAKNFAEAVKRFGAVTQKYPNTEQAYLATLGLASVQYQTGHLDEAVKIASSIPDGERMGDLSAVNYLLGDCQLRALPQEAGDDALATAHLMQDLEETSDRFKSFVLAHDGDPRMVDASLKMGFCLQKIASLTADPTERRKPMQAARRMYMGLVRQFPDSPLYPIVVLESARCTMNYGGRMAENELARFQYEPLKNSPLAPAALIRLSEAMRNSRRSDAAVKLLTSAQLDYEQRLAKDPARAAWASALRFGLGMALKESGRYSEAEPVLASILRDYRGGPEAQEAAWRVAQCKRDAAMEKLVPNRRFFGRRDAAERSKADVAEALDELRNAAKIMAAEAKAKEGQSELAAQIAWESAACWRTVSEVEAESTRVAAQEEAQRTRQRIKQRLPATAPTTKPVAMENAGQEAVKEARGEYAFILKVAPDSSLAEETKRALAELDLQKTPPQNLFNMRKRATFGVPVAKSALPPVLNLDGTSEFPKIEPLVRNSSADLTDEETGQIDEGLMARSIALPEELVGTTARQ